MTIEFGDVVVVEFPFTDGERSKRRPAVAISARDYVEQRADVILMAITSQVSPAGGELEAFVMKWQEAGLAKPSALKPVVFTIDQRLIRAKIGSLMPDDVQQLRDLLSHMLG
jgi:mRNA interferase MazF